MNNIKKINLKIENANTTLKKYLGLMFRIKKIDYGMLFENVNSIHTFFMFQKIDVILLDKDMKAIYTYDSLKPYKVILPKKDVYYTLELPNNYIKTNHIEVNDKIILKS